LSPVRTFTVAAVQMRSTADRERNLAEAERHADAAARRGASLIAFPENVAHLRRERDGAPPAETIDGPTARRFGAMAKRHRAYVLAGSIAERATRRGKVFNTSILFDPKGEIAAVYRKLHLFDIAIPGKANFRESRLVEPGREVVVADTRLARLGLSICYDLRFPELYRRLTRGGAQVLLVPSAFTAYTGRFHWSTLLRARAIENLAWVVAPAQWGLHHPGRRSYGHTCVIDPWGKVVVSKDQGEGVVTAKIDLDHLDRIRRELPALEHARPDLRS
jgi:predicted amidohydrolase